MLFPNMINDNNPVPSENPNTKQIVLLITHRCNLNCRYCYEKHKDSAVMSADVCKEILEKEFSGLKDEKGSLAISFLGGEPLLNEDLIMEVSEWLWNKKKGQSFTLDITTNGTVLSKKMREWLGKNKHRIDVTLSLDGLGEIQSINRTSAKIDVDFFISNWPHRRVNVVLFPDSINLFAQSVREMICRGIKVSVAIGEGIYWSQEALREYERQLENLQDDFIDEPLAGRRCGIFLNIEHCCGAVPETLPLCTIENSNTACYDAMGNLYACHMLSPIVLGKQAEYYAQMQKVNSSYQVDADCLECILFHLCKPCPAMNIMVLNDITKNAARVTSCKMRKIQARQSAVLYCRFISRLTEKGGVLGQIENDLLRKAISIIKCIPTASEL